MFARLRGLRARLLVAATVATLIALAGVAFADTGDLTPRNCFGDNDSSFETGCTNYNNGLTDARSVAVSPDGKSVYVASGGDNALVAYDRNTTSGQIAFSGCIDDNDTAPDKCAQSTDGLGGARSVAVSADNKSVYVVSSGDHAIVRFNRNTTTGDLTPAGCVEDNDFGPDACAQSTDGLGTALSVAVSADNKSVYVASFNDAAIVRFNRNTTTGALTPAGCVDDNDSGPEPCAQSTDGLGGARSVAVSAGGNSVYVVSSGDHAIVRFNRNTTSGALTAAGCVEDEDTGPDACAATNDGLASAQSVAVSPDGKSVYAASFFDNAISRFNRTTSGALTPKGCVDDRGSLAEDCGASTFGLDGAAAVAVSADNKSVYVASESDDAVVGFERMTATGSLVSQGCVDDNDAVLDPCAQSTDGLEGAVSTAVSRDGKSVYVASQFDDAIVRFKREQ